MSISFPTASMPPRQFVSSNYAKDFLDSGYEPKSQSYSTEVDPVELTTEEITLEGVTTDAHLELIPIVGVDPIFTSKAASSKLKLTEVFLPILDMNEEIVVQCQTQECNHFKRTSLIIHEVRSENSFNMPLLNVNLINAVQVAKAVNRIIIHSDDKFLKILNIDTPSYSFLGADLCKDSQVLITNDASIIVATLSDKIFRIWKSINHGRFYKGINFFAQLEDLGNLCFNHDQSSLLFTYRKDAQIFLGICNLNSKNPFEGFKSISLGNSNISFFQASQNSPYALFQRDDGVSRFVDLENFEFMKQNIDFSERIVSPCLRFSVNGKEIFDVISNQSYPIQKPEQVKDLVLKGTGFSLEQDDFFMIFGNFLVRFNLLDGKMMNILDLKFEATNLAVSRSENFLAGAHANNKVSVWRIR